MSSRSALPPRDDGLPNDQDHAKHRSDIEQDVESENPRVLAGRLPATEPRVDRPKLEIVLRIENARDARHVDERYPPPD